MLRLEVSGKEHFDQETNKFYTVPDTVLELEHSLSSISKWESKYEITFLSEAKKDTAMISYYIKCMSLSGDISDLTISSLSEEDVRTIGEYIKSKQTATRFAELPMSRGGSREKITSDLIYYWMIALQIPWEAQYWHLERLLTLIEICQRKNQASSKKMNRSDMARHRRAVNAQRRQQYGTTG